MAADANITGIEFEIRGNSSSAAKGIDQLKESLSKLKGALSATGLSAVTTGLRSISDEAKRASKNVNALTQSLSKVGKNATSSVSKSMGDVSNTAQKAAKTISDLGDKMKVAGDTRTLKEASKSIEVLSDAADKAVNSVSKIAESTGKVKTANTIKETIEQIKDVGNSADESSKKVTRSFADTFKTIQSFGSTVFSTLSKVVKKIPQSNLFKAFTKGARQAGSAMFNFGKQIASMPFKKPIQSIQTLTNKLSGVAAAFKRIIFYRAIRTIIKNITAGFQEGIQNLRAWSESVGGEFARSMDSMTTSMNYFKNSVAAMAAPLYNAFAPALEYVIDRVVDFINKINQLFALLTGASYWTRAKKVAAGYAESAGSAGRAAKEAMKYLAPFDELNVLPSDSGRGGGGGGGSDAGVGDLFETVSTFDSAIADFAAQIKAKINQGDWEGVGNLLAEKLSNALDSIPWKNIQTKAETIATNIARTINGFIENPKIWGSTGRTIGEAINTVTGTVSAYFDTVKWKELGKGIVTALDTALDTIDAAQLGHSIASVANSGVDKAYGFLSKGVEQGTFKKFGTKIGQAISNAIKDFHWDEFGGNIGLAITALFEFIGSIFENIDPIELSNGVKTAFQSMLDNFDWQKVGGGIESFLDGFFTFLEDLTDSGQLEEFAKKIGLALQKVDWGKHLKQAATIFWNVLTDLIKGLAETKVGRIIINVAALMTVAKLAPLANAVLAVFTGTTFKTGIANALTAAVNGAGGAGTTGTAGAAGAGAKSGFGLGPAALLGLEAYGVQRLIGVGKDIYNANFNPNTTQAERDLINQPYIKELETTTKRGGTINAEGDNALLKLLGLDNTGGKGKKTASIGGAAYANITVQAKYKDNKAKQVIEQAQSVSKAKKTTVNRELNYTKSTLSGAVLSEYENTKDKTVKVVLTGEKSSSYKSASEGYQGKDWTQKEARKTLLADKKAGGNYDAYKTDFSTWKDGEVTKLLDAKKSNGNYDAYKKDFTSWGNSNVAKILLADKKAGGNYDAYKKDFSAWKSGEVSKSLTANKKSGGNYDAYKKDYTGWKSASVAKTLLADKKAGGNYDAYKKDYNNWKSNTAKKTVDATKTNGFNNARNEYNSMGNKSVTVTINGVIKPSSTTISGVTIKATRVVDSMGRTLQLKAGGGVYANGSWHNIQAYASGGMPTGGQLFVAREAGPELVGTLRGHTAVMNNNQIVSSVASGVAQAISSIKFNITGLGDPMASAARIMQAQTETIAQSMNDVANKYMIAQSDEDTEGMLYNAMLRALNDNGADQSQEITTYLDGDVIYKNTIRRNQQTIMRTGVNPLMA